MAYQLFYFVKNDPEKEPQVTYFRYKKDLLRFLKIYPDLINPHFYKVPMNLGYFEDEGDVIGFRAKRYLNRKK